MENDRKPRARNEFGAARPRRGMRAEDRQGRGGEVDLEALLAAHCRQAVTLLPRGVLGVATAIEFLEAMPAGYRLGLPDVTYSGPKLFALLVAHGVLAAMPSPRVVPAALGLVAGVSPLLEPRSARQWSLWLGQLREPASAVTAALRKRTPTSQISLAPSTTTARPLRAAALRADRDHLASELARATEALARAREQAEDESARAAALQHRLEEKSAASALRKDSREKMLASIRETLNIPADDPREFAEVVVGVMVSLREQTARADKAQQGLHRLLADLAAADLQLATLREEKRETEAHLDSYEIELAVAHAELGLRRSKMFRPEAAEVNEYRTAGAEGARRAQQRRRSEGK